MSGVRLDPAAHHPIAGDFQSVVAVLEMFDRQGAAHLLDQSPQQHQQIVFRIPDGLEGVPCRLSVAKLERIESNAGPEQVGAKVKLVEISHAIGEPHGFELGVFESFQPGCLCHLGVEASAAEPAVSPLDGAVVDEVVAWRALATTVATDLVAWGGCGSIHAQ